MPFDIADNLTIAGAICGLLAFAWNIFSFLGDGWPRLHLAPTGDNYNDRELLIVTNGSKRPLQVTRMWQILRRNGGLDVFPKTSSLGITVEIAADWIESRWRGQLMLYLPPESSDALRVTLRKAGGAGLIILWSHRFWALPLSMPSFVWVSARRIEQIRRGSRHKAERE
jgi:hypothetical protein